MQRLFRSFHFAFQGIGQAFRTQPNMRIQLVIAAAVVIAGVWLNISPAEWAIIALTIAVVLSAESFNTAIEATVDRIGNEPHPLAKTAKDAAAGAVLICAIGAAVVGVLIFGPRLLTLMGVR
jgi:diacylglycerol kinase